MGSIKEGERLGGGCADSVSDHLGVAGERVSRRGRCATFLRTEGPTCLAAGRRGHGGAGLAAGSTRRRCITPATTRQRAASHAVVLHLAPLGAVLLFIGFVGGRVLHSAVTSAESEPREGQKN